MLLKHLATEDPKKRKISKLPIALQEDDVRNFAKYSRQGIGPAAFDIILDWHMLIKNEPYRTKIQTEQGDG